MQGTYNVTACLHVLFSVPECVGTWSQDSGPELLDMENVARAVGKVLMSGKIRARAYTVRDLWIGRQLSYKAVQVTTASCLLCPVTTWHPVTQCSRTP